jgi:hypothetical protein
MAIRASKRLHKKELLVTTLAGTNLRMEMDKVPLWRGDYVSIKIAHLVGLPDAQVHVTLERESIVPGGVPDSVRRTVTENSRQLKFSSHGFESEQE